MRTRSVLLSLAGLPLLAQVSPVAFSEFKDVVPAFDSTGAITLPAARVKLDIAYPRSKNERRELTVVHDPRTGYYFTGSQRRAERISSSPTEHVFQITVPKQWSMRLFLDTDLTVAGDGGRILETRRPAAQVVSAAGRDQATVDLVVR